MKHALKKACAMALAVLLAAPSALSAEDEELTWIKDGTLYVSDRVTVVGDTWLETVADDSVEDGFQEIYAPTTEDDVMIYLANDQIYMRDVLTALQIDRVVLPDSVRVIGDMGLAFLSLEELRLGSGTRFVSSDALYAATVEKMVIPRGYQADLPSGQYMTVRSYVVEEGNERYKSADGVLFSADGTTLLRYPNGKRDLHYDVPRGVTRIADYAFSDDLSIIPLKTISLPIGLTAIGKNALSGCVRLQSLTVPLTVTQLDPTAFDECVSLERLSLPPGLTARLDSHSVDPTDFTHYVGDNGATGAGGTDDRKEDAASFEARVISKDGVSPVPFYASADSGLPSGRVAPGEIVSIEQVRSGRGMEDVYDRETHSRIRRWYDLADIRSRESDPPLIISRAVPIGETVRLENGGTVPRDKCVFYDVSMLNDEVDFIVIPDEPFDEDEENDAEVVTLPIRETRLYHRPDGRHYAIVAPDGEAAAAPMYDRPDGENTAFCYPGDPLIILKEEDGWLYADSGWATGWLRESDCLKIHEDNGGNE